MSGRRGQWVYYLRGGKQCRRMYVVPRDPRTAKQLRVRAAFGAASRAWSHSRRLREEDREEWRVEGKKVQSRVRLMQSGELTGQMYFVGRNCARERMGMGLMWEPPGRGRDEGRMKNAECRMGKGGWVMEVMGLQGFVRSTWERPRSAPGVPREWPGSNATGGRGCSSRFGRVGRGRRRAGERAPSLAGGIG